MTEQLKIARIGHRGDGIADTNAGPVYVPYALPGETVTVEPVGGHPDRRHLLSVDHASHERVTPICKHFGICGGCATQHWSLAEYLLWKRNLVVEALGHAGLIAPVDSIIDARKTLVDADLSERLKEIDTPTLLLHGDASPFVSVALMSDMKSRLGARQC